MEITNDLFSESDRGAVIVAAALLDSDLDKILKRVVQSHNISVKHEKIMFSLNGPFSNFYSKSLICYGFGFISKEIFDDLTKIRNLRNKFAHSSGKVDFLSPEIGNQVDTMNCCIQAKKKLKGPRYKFIGKDPSDDHPELEDWEARSMGFVKYTKSVFCIGVQILRLKILRFHLKSILK